MGFRDRPFERQAHSAAVLWRIHLTDVPDDNLAAGGYSPHFAPASEMLE